jgi:hypothetical protein
MWPNILTTASEIMIRKPAREIVPRRPGEEEDADDFKSNFLTHNIFDSLHVFPDGTKPPQLENKNAILRELEKSRSFALPSSNDPMRDLGRAMLASHTQRELIGVVSSAFQIEDDGDLMGRGVSFTNLDHLTDGKLAPAWPDVCHGARPEQVDQLVRTRFSGAIIPSNLEGIPVAPNFFLEIDGLRGPLLQSRIEYDIALGARGQWALESNGGCDPHYPYDNKARAIGCHFSHRGFLVFYAAHVTPPSVPGGQPGFVTTKLKCFDMYGRRFQEGVAAYHNAKAWAKRQRDQAIKQANERVKIRGGGEISW